MTRRGSPCRRRMWPTTASNTLTSPCWRSAAKVRPPRPRQERTLGPSPSSNGVSSIRRPIGLSAAANDLGVEEHALGRHRLVGRAAELVLLQRLVARLVVLGDLLEAALGRFIAAMIEADRHARQIVEQRLEVIVEQRQPVLLARIAVAGAHRLVQRIVAGVAAEQLDVARAEQLLGLLAERDLAHRHQRQLLHRLGRALRRDVEGLDASPALSPKKSRRTGLDRPGGKRSRMPPRTAYSPCSITVPDARIAHQRQALRQLRHVDALAGRQRLDGALHEAARRHALQRWR